MSKGTIAAILLGCSAISAPAFAADNGIYLGGSVGQSRVEFEDNFEGNEFDFDADSTGFKVIAGWRFLDWLAVEANYVDLGSGDDSVAGTRIETDVDGFSASVLGFVPIGPVDLMGRIGAVSWNAEVQAPDFDLEGDDDGTDFTYGLGAQFRVWGLSLRAEWERFDIESADSVDMISIGLTYTFL